jgi:predicted CoA-substrate-specific enzyme activase
VKYCAGVDIGASTAKAVVLDAQMQLVGFAVQYSGADFTGAAESTFAAACDQANLDPGKISAIVSTGYGRRNVPFATDNKTEISCHARGSYHHFGKAHTLIDIGGQDNKVIRVDDDGRRTSFKMNRKCAAGTGAFLEEIANRLKVDLGALNGLAEQSTRDIQIGSYCTVFAGTEILARIREGVSVADIVNGIFTSVIKRTLEMDPLDGEIVMSGGVVEHNPHLVKMFEDKMDCSVFVPPHPQLMGAFGAALYAREAE